MRLKNKARLLPLLVALFSTAVFAQDAAKSKKNSSPVKPARSTAPDPLAEARRTSAIALVTSLADSARSFNDPTLRARAQARAADLLWDADNVRAFDLFRRAWEAAEAGDAENARRVEESKNTPQGRAAPYNAPNLRREVLRIASKRSRELGEEFLIKLEKETKTDGGPASSPSVPGDQQTARFNPDNPPPSITQRLRLAGEMLQEGNLARALQFADPALYPVSTFGVNFLDTLREKSPAEADQRYAGLLARAANDPSADGNTVSLLSSYAFTPYLYVTFQGDLGSHTQQWSEGNKRPSDFPPQLRDAFFGVASGILLRPVPPLEQDLSTTKRSGTFFVIERLLPLFEQYAPNYTPQLRVRQAMLLQDTPEKLRQDSADVVRRGIGPEEPQSNQEEQFLERIGRAKNQDERDQLYFHAAMRLAKSNPQRSREFADKIEDSSLRDQLRAVMDFQALNDAIRNKKPEEAIQAAHGTSLTPLQRAWGLTEAAKLLGRKEADRAAEVLEEAFVDAQRIEKGSADRVRALVAIATQIYQINRLRAWEITSEVVRAANSIDSYTGADGGLVVRAEFKGGGAMTMNFNVESFDLEGIFGLLAKEDYYRAVELAKSFTGEAPRTAATLAVAGTGIKKSTGNPVPKTGG